MKFSILEDNIKSHVYKVTEQCNKFQELVKEVKFVTKTIKDNVASYNDLTKKHNKKTLFGMFAGGFIVSAVFSSILFVYLIGEWFVK